MQEEKEKSKAERRLKLKLKLKEEEEQYYAEMQQFQESPEERRQKLAEKADRLLQLREKERAKLKEELLERQFKESCDPLRKSLSEKMCQKIHQDRKLQVEPLVSVLTNNIPFRSTKRSTERC